MDDLSSGKESNLADALAAGATLHTADIRDGDAMRELFASVKPEVVFHLAAQIDVRVSVGRSGLRRAHERRGDGQPARDGPPERRAPLRVRLHRRRDLRRDRRHAHARGHRGAPDGAVRHEQAVRRAVPRALRAPARHVDRGAALRQRLRAPPGRARRGGRHRDLLRAAAPRRGPAGLRRRRADPRLHLRRRPRRGDRHRGRGRRHRRDQPRHRGGDLRAARGRAAAVARGRDLADRLPARRVWARSSARSSHAGRAREVLGWSAATRIDEGLRLTWEASADA